MKFLRSIRFKMVVIIVFLFLTLVTATYSITNKVMIDGFSQVEKQTMQENLNRIENAYLADLNNLSVKVSDWSSWDDTYEFIDDQNKEYAASNLNHLSLENLQIDFIFFLGTNGQIVSESASNYEIPMSLRQELTNGSAIPSDWLDVASSVGTLNLDGQLFMFAAKPILTSENLGPSRGSIIFVRVINEEYIERLAKVTNFEIKLGEPHIGEKYSIHFDQELVGGSVIINDFFNQPAFSFATQYPAKIIGQGNKSIDYFMLFFGGLGILILLILTLLIDKLYLKRVETLALEVTDAGDSATATTTVQVTGNDEISTLAININKTIENLRKFELALSNTSDHVVVTDPEGLITYANKAAQVITGYSLEEMLGQTPRLWGKQMSADFYKKMWHTIKVEKKSFTGEIRNIRKDGVLYSVYSTISPIIDTKGELVGFVGVENDISELKKYQTNLEEMVGRRTIELKASIEAIARAYVLINSEGKIVLTNSKLSKFFGEPEGEWTLDKIDQKLSKVYQVKKMFEECLRTKQPIAGKEIAYGFNFYDVVLFPVLDKEKIIGVLMMTGDITEQKAMERSRDEFFSIASHELRTPLTAIRGNVSMINDIYSDKIKDPEFKEMMADIYESSIRLISIVNDFLDTSRLEMGRIEFKRESYEFTEVVEDVVSELKESAALKNLTIELEKPKEKLPKLVGDKDKVKEILINLVGNSIKFTEKGGLKISTTVAKDLLEVRVTDSGRGISPENQPQLFRKFQQANANI